MNKMMTRRWVQGVCALACACGVALGAMGCEEIVDQVVPKDDETANAATASLGLSATESALLAISVEDADETQTPAQIAEAAAARVAAQFTPAGCATANTTVPGTLGLDLNGCTGPYGLVSVTGKAAIVFTIDQGDVFASLTATDLQANDATMTINASGLLTKTGEDRMIALTTNGAGTGPNGRIVARNGSYTYSWNTTTKCFKLVGTWVTTLTTANPNADNDAAWTTTVKDYGRCPGKCPDDGGSITYAGTGSNADAAALTITFDGSEKAIYASTRGAGGTLAVSCQ